MLELCKHYRVAKLVYTSSPSVVFTGNDDEGINESAPYPPRYLSSYPKTKAEAERLVLSANSEHLATIAFTTSFDLGARRYAHRAARPQARTGSSAAARR